jgi:hypothetical protein
MGHLPLEDIRLSGLVNPLEQRNQGIKKCLHMRLGVKVQEHWYCHLPMIIFNADSAAARVDSHSIQRAI